MTVSYGSVQQKGVSYQLENGVKLLVLSQTPAGSVTTNHKSVTMRQALKSRHWEETSFHLRSKRVKRGELCDLIFSVLEQRQTKCEYGSWGWMYGLTWETNKRVDYIKSIYWVTTTQTSTGFVRATFAAFSAWSRIITGNCSHTLHKEPIFVWFFILFLKLSASSNLLLWMRTALIFISLKRL